MFLEFPKTKSISSLSEHSTPLVSICLVFSSNDWFLSSLAMMVVHEVLTLRSRKCKLIYSTKTTDDLDKMFV